MDATEIEPEAMPPQVLRADARRRRDEILVPEHRAGGLPLPERNRLLADLSPDTLARNADQLPVLAAFQEFLDIERRRTRARLLGLLTIFGLLFLVLGGGVIVAGLHYYRQTEHGVGAIRDELRHTRASAERADAAHETAVAKWEAHAAELANAMASQQDALAHTRTEAAARVSTLGADLAALQAALVRVQTNQVGLHTELITSTDRWQAISNEIFRTIMELQAPLPPIPESLQVVRSGPVASAAADRPPLILAIIPRGSTQASDWRVPYPLTTE